PCAPPPPRGAAPPPRGGALPPHADALPPRAARPRHPPAAPAAAAADFPCTHRAPPPRSGPTTRPDSGASSRLLPLVGSSNGPAQRPSIANSAARRSVGDQSGTFAPASDITRRSRPVKVSTTYAPCPLARTLVYTSCLPSGAQLGSSFSPACVTWLTGAPTFAASATMIWNQPPRDFPGSATCVPVGDQSGDV